MPYYTYESPPYASAGAGIDLDARAIRFPIQVVTSLGLSGTTYTWLAVVGVALSGLLRSGWLWKILELFRARREQLSAAGLSSWSAKQLSRSDYRAHSTILVSKHCLEEEMHKVEYFDELVSKKHTSIRLVS